MDKLCLLEQNKIETQKMTKMQEKSTEVFMKYFGQENCAK